MVPHPQKPPYRDRRTPAPWPVRRVAGIDLFWIVAIGIVLALLRLFAWLLASGGLIGEDDATAAFLIALPAAVVFGAWLMPIDPSD